MLAKNYQGYKGIPPLVGLHTMEEAIGVGLTVAESVDRLKRFHWMAKELSQLLVSRITSMPIYEVKMAFSHHAHVLSEHVDPFFDRVREMREPPYGMDTTPHAALDLLLDELQCAPTPEALVLGLYGVAIPAFVRSLERVMEDDNRLFNHPTYRVCRFAHIELQEIAEYGAKVLEALITPTEREAQHAWLSLLAQCLDAMGDLDGALPSQGALPDRLYSASPFVYDNVPRRDERFKDVYNMRVNAEAFLLDREIDALPKTLMLYFKRMREIDVPEMMASIVYETKGKPWGYYKDMMRQIWDEARHAMMGEVGFTSIGIDWKEIPFNITWSYLLNTGLTSKERHSILFLIEQGLMPAKTGKKYEWEVAVATANRLAELIQDYDWADEVLHAHIGRQWIVPEIGSQPEALEFGSQAWSNALRDAYDRFAEAGLTEHRNWWPEIYAKACAQWGIPVDPKLLAFDENYKDTRADRKKV